MKKIFTIQFSPGHLEWVDFGNPSVYNVYDILYRSFDISVRDILEKV